MIPDFPGLNMNPTATRKNVPEIERKIRIIKERAQSIRIKILFKRTPNRIIIELLKFVVMWFRAFLVKSGVSYAFIPHTIMNGTTLDWQKHCKASFGAYWEVHEDNRPLNNITTSKHKMLSALAQAPTSKADKPSFA